MCPSLGFELQSPGTKNQCASNELHRFDIYIIFTDIIFFQQYPDYYFTPEIHQQPPPEESLYQNSLWPELQKLYGHGYEIFSLASDGAGKLIASACKAAKAEHAQVS